MKSNKKQITCRRDRGYTVVWSLSFGFGSRLAMFVVLGFFGKVRYKFRFVQSVFWLKFIR